MFPAKVVTKSIRGAGCPAVLAPALAHLIGAAAGLTLAGEAGVGWRKVREIRVPAAEQAPDRVGHVHAEVGSWWAEASVWAEAGQLRVHMRWRKGAYAEPHAGVTLAWQVLE